MNRWLLLVLGAVLLGALILLLASAFPDALMAGDGQMRLTHSLLIVALVAGSAILHGRFRAAQAARHAAIWLAIGAVLLLAYSFRHEARDLGSRLLGELVPSRAQVGPGGAVALRASSHGHFVAEALVNGIPVRFLVDTGASDVVLSPADADRLGFDASRLSFTRTYRTANGTVRGAPVRLQEVAIGPIVLRDVAASVNGAAMDRSLLGMSFLSRLGGYDVSRDTLTLRPPP